MDTAVDSYSATAEAWQAGPGRMYDRLAHVVVGFSPVRVHGRLMLDVGAGTGAASRAIASAGGRPVAVDPAVGMLAVDRTRRPPAAVAEALALPIRAHAVDGVVAAFSFNHVDDVVGAFRAAALVTDAGGPIVVSSYADDDAHPVKAAVAETLSACGWKPPEWDDHLRTVTAPALGTPERCANAAKAAGLDATVHALHVPFADLDAAALVAWRLGMAQTAPFFAGLSPPERVAVIDEALRRLGDVWPPLVRSVLVVTAVT